MRNNNCPVGFFIILFFVSCYFIGCTSNGTDTDGKTPTSCGSTIQTDPYDTDGDGISNDVENNNRNYVDGTIPHPQFEPDSTCNSDPSKAIGTFDNGSLDSGINLPDEISGKDGYYHYIGSGDWYDYQDGDDWGTLSLINMIEKTGLDFSSPPVGIGDMSVKNGGDIPHHGSHENGTDVDVRFVRSDGKCGENDGALDLRFFDSIYYDKGSTLILMNSFVANGNVTDIYVHTQLAKITSNDISVIRHDTTHFNHFHVRIAKP